MLDTKVATIGLRCIIGQRATAAIRSALVAIRINRLCAPVWKRARNAKKISVAKINMSVSGMMQKNRLSRPGGPSCLTSESVAAKTPRITIRHASTRPAMPSLR